MNKEYIKNVFSMLRTSEIRIHLIKYNYKIQGQFERNSARINAECSKGHKISFSVQQMIDGKGCKFCKESLEPIVLTSFAYFKSNLEIKHLEEVLKAIKFEIIDKNIDYETFNVDLPLNMICSNGHEIKRSYHQIINREQRCKKCYYKGLDTKPKKETDQKHRVYSEAEIKELLREEGCELLSPYINSTTPFIFQCSCGSQGQTTTYNFLNRGVRCSYCKAKKRKDTIRTRRKEESNWSGTREED